MMNNNKILENIDSSLDTIRENLAEGRNLSDSDLNILHFIDYNLEKIRINIELKKENKSLYQKIKNKGKK
jgi:hypothetical protein